MTQTRMDPARNDLRLTPKQPDFDENYLKQCLVYKPETGDFFWRTRPTNHFSSPATAKRWNSSYSGKAAGCLDEKGYRRITINCRRYAAHHLAWFYHHGEFPPKQIDHINHCRSDNRIKNLRAVTTRTNQKNYPLFVTNKSGTCGVSWKTEAKKWRVCIGINGRTAHVGHFANLDDAIAARKAAEIEHGYHPNHGLPVPGNQSGD